MNIFKSTIIAFWRRIFDRPYKTKYVQIELPKKLKRNIIYIIKEDGFAENAAMLCPCDCGKVLYMNLLPDERPCWNYSEHPDGTITLHPSVWRKKDCGSHFWFRQGRIYWC